MKDAQVFCLSTRWLKCWERHESFQSHRNSPIFFCALRNVISAIFWQRKLNELVILSSYKQLQKHEKRPPPHQNSFKLDLLMRVRALVCVLILKFLFCSQLYSLIATWKKAFFWKYADYRNLAKRKILSLTKPLPLECPTIFTPLECP